jgi:hypothetical protein
MRRSLLLAGLCQLAALRASASSGPAATVARAIVNDLDVGLAEELKLRSVRWVVALRDQSDCGAKLQALKSAGLVVRCAGTMADVKDLWKGLSAELQQHPDAAFAAVTFQADYRTLPVLMAMAHFMKRLKVVAAYGVNTERGPYVALAAGFDGTYSKVLFKSENKYRNQFNEIYEKKLWSEAGGGSGPGSDVQFTARVREGLLAILQKYSIRSMLDSSCGSMVWMPITLRAIAATVPDFKFLGTDVACSLIDKHRQAFANETRWGFQCLDYANEPIPSGYDLVFCRDSLQHVPW